MNLANPPTNATTREAGRLLIIGASARAAAHSAERAGYIPLAIDRFNDLDLQTSCEQVAIYQHLRDIPRLVAEFPNCDWLYTGPLENHPQLLRQLSAPRLLGNPAEVVERVRDPWILARELNDAGLNVPEVLPRGEQPDSGRWLNKSLRSAGGCGITEYTVSLSKATEHYFQRYVEGTPHSAIFIGAGATAALAGVTEQLVGHEWLAGGEFQYAGSVGPIALPDSSTEQLARLGQYLAKQFHLRGLFGVDFILSSEEVWPVEVNPRYTASVEVVERATHLHLLQLHIEACRWGRVPPNVSLVSEHASGKAIIYSPADLTATERLITEIRQSASQHASAIADLPTPEVVIKTGDPVFTALLAAETPDIVKGRLRETVAATHSLLASMTASPQRSNPVRK